MDNNIHYNNILPIATNNLIIKPTTINDIDLILKLDKQEITQKYLGGIKNKTKKERLAFLKRKANSLTVYLKNDIPIGFIGLNMDKKNNSTEISYIFDQDYCNKGYCTEACKRLIDICFKELKIQSITADTIIDNNNSKRVLEKLGFKKESKFQKNTKTFIKYTIYNKELKKDDVK